MSSAFFDTDDRRHREAEIKNAMSIHLTIATPVRDIDPSQFSDSRPRQASQVTIYIPSRSYNRNSTVLGVILVKEFEPIRQEAQNCFEHLAKSILVKIDLH